MGEPTLSTAALYAAYTLSGSCPPRLSARSRRRTCPPTRSSSSRVLAEEVLAHVGAVLGLEVLVFAVDALLHALEQQPDLSAAISGSQPDPQITLTAFQPAPRKMPSSSWMIFPLPRRAVQALRVAVHHEDQVVQLLPAGQRDRPSDSGSSISPSPRNAHMPVRSMASSRLARYLRNGPGRWPSAGPAPSTPWGTASNRASATGADRTTGRRRRPPAGTRHLLLGQPPLHE